MRTTIVKDEITQKQKPTTSSDRPAGHRRAALDFALASGEELDDCSLLEAILHQHHAEPIAEMIAKQLLERFSNLSEVLNSNMRQLLSVSGLTLCSAAGIFRAGHLSKAVLKTSIRDKSIFRSHQQILDYSKAILAGADREEFHALFFNRRGNLAGHSCLQRGTIDHVSVYPREVLRRVIEFDASYLVLVHNHPFGKARPSNADIAMTRQLAQLTAMIGAQIYDHVIVSSNATFSFRERLPSGLQAAKRNLPLSLKEIA